MGLNRISWKLKLKTQFGQPFGTLPMGLNRISWKPRNNQHSQYWSPGHPTDGFKSD